MTDKPLPPSLLWLRSPFPAWVQRLECPYCGIGPIMVRYPQAAPQIGWV